MSTYNPSGAKMKDNIFIITYDGVPLVVISDLPNFLLPSDILSWYAEKYAFERSKLKYSMVPVVKYDVQ